MDQTTASKTLRYLKLLLDRRKGPTRLDDPFERARTATAYKLMAFLGSEDWQAGRAMLKATGTSILIARAEPEPTKKRDGDFTTETIRRNELRLTEHGLQRWARSVSVTDFRGDRHLQGWTSATLHELASPKGEAMDHEEAAAFLYAPLTELLLLDASGRPARLTIVEALILELGRLAHEMLTGHEGATLR